MERNLLEDFDVYARALIKSNDVDPTYLIIPDIVKKYGFEPMWFTFCYVAFYSLESGIKMCQEMPIHLGFHPKQFREMRATRLAKFGHERRGTQRIVDNQIAMFEHVKYFICKKQEHIANGTFRDNATFRATIQKNISNHGGWASFKIAEILEKCFPEEYASLEVPDLGLDGRDVNSNDGPVGGLRWLYGRDNEYTNEFISIWNDFGNKLAEKYNVNIGVIETCFCKFHKMVSGKYYIGHDIAEFAELEHTLGTKDYEAIMSKHFHEKFWKGKNGVEKAKKSIYNKSGVILSKEFGNKLKSVDIFETIMED